LTDAGTKAGGATVLRAKIGLVLGGLATAGERLVRHPRVRELYPEYLFASHCIVRASVPLMQTARDRALALGRDDAVATGLAAYLDDHIPEELDHDEWLLQDLELLGVGRASVLARPPSATVASFVGAQYYWILHYHPVALMGYIALLEGYPPSPGLIDELVSATGYDRAAFRTLIAHATLDPEHRDEFDAALDALPLSAEQTAVVGVSALSSVGLMTRVVDEVVDALAP
jgi:hypothetical protein